MTLNNLLKKIREELNLTQEEMGKRLEVSKSLITQMEKGNKNLSDKTLSKIYELFPEYKKQLDKALLDDRLSSMEDITKINSDSSFLKHYKELETEEYKIPIYDFVSAGNGVLDLNHYEVLELFLPAKVKKIKNIFGVRVHGDSMEPKFEDNDVLILRPDCPDWTELNNKVVVIQINNEKFVKLLVYKDYKPYLFSYNEIYPPVEIYKNDDVRCVGSLVYLVREF